ncbi:MAG: hypothetical protein KGI02_03900 [Thaumarchaeota archaeon]|nr:hypothetical protein [Nitrososphaerota archaeon]MDE2589194.1 hypothetical protein [Patescibacteria group bacterium]
MKTIIGVYPNVTSVTHLDDNHICNEIGDIQDDNHISLVNQLGATRLTQNNKVIETDVSLNPLITNKEITIYQPGTGTMISSSNVSLLHRVVEKILSTPVKILGNKM